MCGEGGVLFVYSDRRPAFGSCRQRYIFCTLTGDLLSGLVGREVLFFCTLTGDLLSGLVGREGRMY